MDKKESRINYKLAAILLFLMAFLLAVLLIFLNFRPAGPNKTFFKEEGPSTNLENRKENQPLKKIKGEKPWLTYTDEAVGFNFKYPPEAEARQKIINKMHGYDIFGDDGWHLRLNVYSENCDNDCFQNELVDWWPKTKIEANELTINGYKALEIYFDDNGEVRKEIYLANDNNVVVYFEFSGLGSTEERLSEVEQKILDSFRFAD